MRELGWKGHAPDDRRLRGRQGCHSPLITALLITDKLLVPIHQHEHTNSRMCMDRGTHQRRRGQGHCALLLSRSLVTPITLSPRFLLLPPPPIFSRLSSPLRSAERVPLVLSLLSVPYCPHPFLHLFGVLPQISLGHGCVRLESELKKK